MRIMSVSCNVLRFQLAVWRLGACACIYAHSAIASSSACDQHDVSEVCYPALQLAKDSMRVQLCDAGAPVTSRKQLCERHVGYRRIQGTSDNSFVYCVTQRAKSVYAK